MLREPAARSAGSALTLDVEAFRVPVWIAQAAPVPEPPQVPPPPPLRVQLLAIFRDGDVFRAALYDPDSDRLMVVGAGDAVGIRTVDSVGPTVVTLRDDNGTRTLSLADEGRTVQ